MDFQTEAIKSTFDVRDYTINADQNLPTEFSCPVKVLVKNQGFKPTCVAHAAASVVEYHHKRQNNNRYRAFSTEFIYGTREDGYYVGDGMSIRDALKTLHKYGDPYKTDCPGNNDYEKAMNVVRTNWDAYKEFAYPHRISNYYRCYSNDDIKTALVKHGPVLVSMNTYDNAQIVDDMYVYDETAEHGCHCVMIYGYNERGWLVQNSWGQLYAGDGRFMMPFNYRFNEAWGIADELNEGELNIKKQNAFTNAIYCLYNTVVNWWINVTNRT